MKPSYLITVDGKMTPITPANGQHFDLAEMQQAVGGYIETVAAVGDRSRLLIVNEDGRALGLAPNYAATLLAGKTILGPAMLIPQEAIV